MRAFERQIGMAVPLMGPYVMEQSLLRQLVKDAKAGDLPSFERIVILHERLVMRVAQRLLLNREDAKDAAQEVFLRVHRMLDRFDEQKELAPWLYRLTVNICRDFLRRRSNREISFTETDEFVNPESNPEQSASAAEQYEIMRNSLQLLTTREREVIVLRDLEGQSTKEVAEILGSSETTVRSQLSTGRIKLKQHVMAYMRKRQ